MLSVIIPTEGVEQTAVATLAALVPGAAAGVVREVLLVDRAGDRRTIERVADVAGCRFLAFEGTRAAAMAAGARQARSPWLMFLHAGAVLDSGWIEETTQFIQGVSQQRPAARRHLPLRPLALCRSAAARRFQVHRPHDRRTVGGTGPADRARSLRAARRLRPRCPPLRGAAAAATRPLLPHAAAQPDHRRLILSVALYLILSNNNLMKSNRCPMPRWKARSPRCAASAGSIPRKLGIIEPKLLDSPWTLQEARIIYEIAQHRGLHRNRPRPRARPRCRLPQPHACRRLQQRQIVARKALKGRPPRQRTRIDRERAAQPLPNSTAARATRSRHCSADSTKASAPPSSTP